MKAAPLFGALALFVVLTPAFGQEAASQSRHSLALLGKKAQPETAEKLLLAARTKAKDQGKNLLVVFHASWCKWCKRLDAFMASPKFKQVFEDSFVTVHLTVDEREEKKADENPGADEVRERLGGKEAGLPFFAILDAEGKMVANSLRPVEGKLNGENTGFPAAPEEVAHFVTMMRKGAPKATAEQIKAIEEFLMQRPETVPPQPANKPPVS